MFWTVTGWLIALASLIVNVLQLRKNRALKNQNSRATLKAGNNSAATSQTHFGTGDNTVIGGSATINKKS